MEVEAMKDQACQTTEAGQPQKCKATVYEKIENSKRCELIRKLQKEKKSLKQAADELGINYSTAKTIVQTFRRERRIAKKPKRSLETKRALRRERHIAKALARSRVSKILAQIISYEFTNPDTCSKPKPTTAIQEVSTAAVPPSDQGNFRSTKPFHRVISAAQMLLFPLEEEGPKEKQVTRGMTTENEAFIGGKDVFYVFSENNPEEEYKEKVDYQNPVTLRSKFKEEWELQYNKLPVLDKALPTSLLSQTNIRTGITQEDNIVFSFTPYTPLILYHYYNR